MSTGVNKKLSTVLRCFIYVKNKGEFSFFFFAFSLGVVQRELNMELSLSSRYDGWRSLEGKGEEGEIFHFKKKLLYLEIFLN